MAGKPKTYVLLDENGNLIERECTECGEVKESGDFGNWKRGVGGKRPHCKDCQSKQHKKWRQNNLEKAIERVRKWRQNNPEKMRERMRKWQQNNPEKVVGYNRKWRQNNPEAWKIYVHNRNARKQALPDTLLKTEWEQVMSDFEGSCPLSGSTENLHMEHFIPLSWGHGGTYLGNVYPLEASLNISMNDNNPFEWIKTRSPEEQQGFDRVVAYLAEQNGLAVPEFKEFVYWCEANKRTVEEIQADGNKTSLELWKERTIVHC